MHEDPVTKSKRVTNSASAIVSTIELDPWGADTNRSNNGAFQPKKFTSYERDANGTDEAMFRRYNRWQSRFDQPDPYNGSYDFTNPQSFNRYAYVQGDPVNLVDPSGLTMMLSGVMWDYGSNSYIGTYSSDIPLSPGDTQNNFDFCAQQALRQFRWRYLQTSGMAIVGGAGVGLDLGVAITGIPRVGVIGLRAFFRTAATGAVIDAEWLSAPSAFLFYYRSVRLLR